MESLTTEQLEDRPRDLIKANKLENKPHSGRNSYFIVENEGSFFPKETSLPSYCFFRRNTHPVTRPNRYAHIRIFQTEGWSRFIQEIHWKLKCWVEAIKMFMKDQFCLVKNSNSEQNVCVSAENTKVIELLQQQNENLIQENAWKNSN